MAEYKERVYLFGDNEDNRKIYDSKGAREGALIDAAMESAHGWAEKIVSDAKRLPVRNVVVVNTGDEEQNFAICREFIRLIESASEEERELYFRYLRISVFGDPHLEARYEELVGGGYGCISYVNKYQQIAMDFIERYPLTKFMDARHIDYQTSLVKAGVDIRVFMLGFGKTNRQIFLTSVANNQFLCEGANGPELKKVEYYIFDKAPQEKKQYLDGSYYRFVNELDGYKEEDYLPLPAVPAKETYFTLPDGDGLYAQLETLLAYGEKGANFVIVACGSDRENIELAQKILEKKKVWKEDHLVVFVKSRNVRKEDTQIEDEDCYFIGNEEDCVFNIEEILGDRIYTMSQLRNAIYDLEYELTSGNKNITEEYVQKNRENATRNWYTSKSQLERESSTYGCLSLRSKLNLMGLDYCGKDENDLPALTQEEYLALYAKGDAPDLTTYAITADGKPIVCYTLDFVDSRRKTMAIHEHQRWNSFMISKGMVPATKKQILEEQTERNGKKRYTNGKNYAARRHGNLTTFEGLIEFRQMVAKRDDCDEGDKDVIKYDYQLLDDAYWLLEKSGCKIVRR